MVCARAIPDRRANDDARVNVRLYVTKGSFNFVNVSLYLCTSRATPATRSLPPRRLPPRSPRLSSEVHHRPSSSSNSSQAPVHRGFPQKFITVRRPRTTRPRWTAATRFPGTRCSVRATDPPRRRPRLLERLRRDPPHLGRRADHLDDAATRTVARGHRESNRRGVEVRAISAPARRRRTHASRPESETRGIYTPRAVDASYR